MANVENYAWFIYILTFLLTFSIFFIVILIVIKCVQTCIQTRIFCFKKRRPRHGEDDNGNNNNNNNGQAVGGASVPGRRRRRRRRRTNIQECFSGIYPTLSSDSDMESDIGEYQIGATPRPAPEHQQASPIVVVQQSHVQPQPHAAAAGLFSNLFNATGSSGGYDNAAFSGEFDEHKTTKTVRSAIINRKYDDMTRYFNKRKQTSKSFYDTKAATAAGAVDQPVINSVCNQVKYQNPYCYSFNLNQLNGGLNGAAAASSSLSTHRPVSVPVDAANLYMHDVVLAQTTAAPYVNLDEDLSIKVDESDEVPPTYEQVINESNF